MADKYKIPVRVAAVLRRMDEYLAFQVEQGRDPPKRLALTLEQYRIMRQHLGQSVYRGMELYPLDN